MLLLPVFSSPQCSGAIPLDISDLTFASSLSSSLDPSPSPSPSGESSPATNISPPVKLSKYGVLNASQSSLIIADSSCDAI